MMLFIILVGYPPFWAENDAEVLKKVFNDQFSSIHPIDMFDVQLHCRTIHVNFGRLSSRFTSSTQVSVVYENT